MGKDLHNDDFEDFFKKHLEGFDGEPADDMWDRIEPVIPPKPGIAWSVYALPSALILSLALLIFVGYKMLEYKKTSEDLTEQLEESNRAVQSLNEDAIVLQKEENVASDSNFNSDTNLNSNHSNDEKPNTLTDNNTDDWNRMTKEDAAIIFKNKKQKTPKYNQQYFTNNKTVNRTKTTQNYEQTVGQETTPTIKKTIPTIQEISKEIQKNKSETTPTVNQPIATTADWKELAMKTPSLPHQNNWVLNKAVTVEKPLLEKVLTNKNSITLFVAPTILKNNIRPPQPPIGNNPPPPNPRPIPTEKVKLGQAFGVKYGYCLTDKLSFNIGGIYANASYRFNTRHFLPYNKDTEQDISTDKAGNTIDYSGSSTYGEYSVGVDVTRLKDNGVTQDENIDIKVEATAKIHSVIVPAYLTYELLETNGFSVGLKGGVSYNNVIANDLQVNSFEVDKEGFEVKDFRLKDRPTPSKNGAINTLSGVVLAYEFQDNWSIMVEPTWTSALSDNHKSDFGRTKSNMFNMEIGVKYSF